MAVIDALTEIGKAPGPERAVFELAAWDEFETHHTSKGDIDEVLMAVAKLPRFARLKFNIYGVTNQTLHWASIEIDRCSALLLITTTEHAGDRKAARVLVEKYAEPFPVPDYDSLGPRALKTETESAMAAIRDAVAETQRLQKVQRDSVQDTTIKHHAKVFSLEADEHKTLADRWFKWALWAVAFLLIVAVVLFVFPVGGEGAFAVGQLLARLTLLSIPATALGVAVRQYSVARHNWVVARHRSNALASYEAFASAIDKAAKDALLVQALTLIFSPQSTGYSKAAAATDAISPFTELVKQIGGGKS